MFLSTFVEWKKKQTKEKENKEEKSFEEFWKRKIIDRWTKRIVEQTNEVSETKKINEIINEDKYEKKKKVKKNYIFPVLFLFCFSSRS